MIFKVEFTSGARQDIKNIYGYIKAAGAPDVAKQLYTDLSKACMSLSQYPNRGHIPSELEGLSDLSCRQIVIRNHRIIYEVIDKKVIIYGIIDGRRDVRETMRQRVYI
ncbi:MAG: type II toxin-antitoxin system RelE/ParE family toxin [Deltaproteobacteria bacterium]|nr:type II toxin-antitoxin system RelE/ParE family toxin [Deltaproteobacteria bacterium]